MFHVLSDLRTAQSGVSGEKSAYTGQRAGASALVEVAQDLLDEELGAAVRVGGRGGEVLRDGHRRGVAVHLSREVREDRS